MVDVVVVSAVRTAVGSFGGTLAPLSAIDLGATVIREALLRADLTPGNVSEVIMGQVLTGGSGQNPARQSSLRAGIPQEIPAWTLNIVCGSGLRSVIQGVLAIQSGMSTIVVAGGQESMSNAPHCAWLRSGIKMGSTELVDTMIRDGLWCAFNQYHMGTTAENIAERWGFTREAQDAFSARSSAKSRGSYQGRTVSRRNCTRRLSRRKRNLSPSIKMSFLVLERQSLWGACDRHFQKTEPLRQATLQVLMMVPQPSCSCQVLLQSKKVYLPWPALNPSLSPELTRPLWGRVRSPHREKHSKMPTGKFRILT